MLKKPKKYINWEEFKNLDSEAQFWKIINNDPKNAFDNMRVVA